MLFSSLGTVGGRAGYSVVKVQLKEAFTYSEVRRGKVNPGPETFLKVPSLIPTFRGRFVNPESENIPNPFQVMLMAIT